MIRHHLWIATALFGVELVTGIGLVGGAGLFIAPLVLLAPSAEKRSFLTRLRTAAVYVCLFAATMALLIANWKLAERRASPVIAACKQFRALHNRYPAELNEIVPALLPSVPNAKYTLVANRFGYDSSRPSLYFSAMFHGVVSYDFQTDTWRTND